MNIYYDTEFLEDGSTIDMISIGMVAEDGREYYAVAEDAPWGRVNEHRWLCENVVPHLPLGRVGSLPPSSPDLYWFDIDRTSQLVRPKWVIANEVRDFILATPDRKLWAWYAAYDHVALCQLWGTMMQLPEGVPMWTNDLKQLVGDFQAPSMPGVQEHNALSDAREVRYRYHDFQQAHGETCPCNRDDYDCDLA